MKSRIDRALRILVTTNGLVLISVAMINPIYAYFVSDVGGTLLDTSYAFAAFAEFLNPSLAANSNDS